MPFKGKINHLSLFGELRYATEKMVEALYWGEWKLSGFCRWREGCLPGGGAVLLEGSKMETWVVVADAGRARFFRVGKPGSLVPPGAGATAEEAPMVLEEFRDLTHPASRLHENEMATDEPGFGTVRNMRGKFGMGSPVEPKEEEAIRFAAVVADALLEDAGKYGRLYLCSAPHFLGLLRKHLDSRVQDRIAAEIDRDYSLLDAGEIGKHLRDLL